MKYALTQIEVSGFYPQLIIYANHHHDRPPNIFTELIEEIQYNGADTVFPAELVTKDSHTFWRKIKQVNYKPVIKCEKTKMINHNYFSLLMELQLSHEAI